MASKIDISNAIVRGYAYAIQLTNELADEQEKGCDDCYDASSIECLLWLTSALQDRIDRDIFDADTDKLYEQLVQATSPYYADATVDPNASIPYTIINVSRGSIGTPFWQDIQGYPADSTSLVAFLPSQIQLFLVSLHIYNTLQELYDYINEELGKGIPESQLLGQSYKGNGAYMYITQSDIDASQEGEVPLPPTNGITNNTEKTFTFTGGQI